MGTRRRGVVAGSALGAVVSLVLASVAAPPATADLRAEVVAPSISAKWSGPAAVEKGRRIGISGRVSSAAGVVRLDRRVGGVWKALTTMAVRSNRTWQAKITVPSAASAQNYRVVWLVDRAPAATGALPTLDVYRLNTYVVTTRGKVTADVDVFVEQAAATYADARGWARAHQRFREVARGGDFTLVLAQAATLASFSPECNARYSCRVGRYVIINQTSWLKKTPAFTGRLRTYRHMVVNHETGHWLGLAHRSCAGTGRRAPVMMQQSKGLKGCTFNAWPVPSELTRAARS